MQDYERMYYKAFNASTDAHKLIQQASGLIKQACEIIRTAQQECEELYIGEDGEYGEM